MKRLMVLVTILLLIGTSKFSSAETFEEFLKGPFKEYLKEGTPYINLRLRYEFVDQDGLAADAGAKTLRTVWGYKTAKRFNFSGVIEGENVTQLGGSNYNNTLNGKTDHPVVADIKNTEVNQGYGEYTGIPDTTIRGGRQTIIHDGHRFIGNVG